MSRLDGIAARLAEIGRPDAEWAKGFRSPGGPLAKAKAWDAEHPALAAEYAALQAERETIERAEQVARLSEKNMSHAMRRISEMGLERAAIAALEPDETQALKYARDWYAGDASWLIVSGSVGVGKTTAAAWVLLQELLRGKSAGSVRSSDLVAMQIDGGVRKLERVDILLIDDLGVEHANGFAQSVMGQLCDARHQLIDVRTIITTNLSREDLEKRVGERVADRWRESSVMKRTSGKSMRQPGEN